MTLLRILAVVTLISTASCAQQDDPILPVPESANTSSPTASAEQGPCEKVVGGTETFVYLSDVDVSTSEGVDRIVFEFSPSDQPPAIPRYEIESVDPPLKKDPSDETMHVDGQRFFRVLFHGATGVELKGEQVMTRYQGPKEIKPGSATLIEAEQQGDFEATLSWILGLGKPRCPKVTHVGPLRLAIDLPH